MRPNDRFGSFPSESAAFACHSMSAMPKSNRCLTSPVACDPSITASDEENPIAKDLSHFAAAALEGQVQNSCWRKLHLATFLRDWYTCQCGCGDATTGSPIVAMAMSAGVPFRATSGITIPITVLPHRIKRSM
jgi:hypothetical protein